RADDARDSAKAKLSPLQDFVGDWKGVGQPQRGKREGSWSETTAWAWKFDEATTAIAFKSNAAKYLLSGALTPSQNEGEYQLAVAAPEDKRLVYVGKLTEDKLVLEAKEPQENMPARITLRLVASGKRLVALYETK